MKSLRGLLVVCAAIAAQSALAQDQPALAAIRAACAQDAQKLCAGVQPGGGRIVACLKEHKDALSDRCKQAAGLAANSSSTSAPSAPSASPASGSNVSGAAPSTPGAASSSGAPAPSAPAAASKTKPATAPKGSSATAKEKFVERIVTDTEHNNMRAATIHLPEKWKFDSKIEWHYDRIEVPLIFSSHSENPDNAEAYFQYPLLRAEIVDAAPQYRQYVKNNTKPGDRMPTGAIWSVPLAPM